MSTPYDHRFEPGREGDCVFEFPYPDSLGRMIIAPCGGEKQHQWHHQHRHNCTRCSDSGVFWRAGTMNAIPWPCSCELGDEMIEFLNP